MADPQPDIKIFNQTDHSLPFDEAVYTKLAESISEKEQSSFSFIEVVYVDEDEIVRINQKHLEHDYVTDIITFRYDESSGNEDIEGTLFCCAPRIVEQAEELGESTEREFLRIFIHGLLHLIGYEDKTNSAKQEMTDKEDTYLSLAESL